MSKQTLFLVFRDVDYEGSDLIAIHTDKAKADALRDECQESGASGDGWRIEEWTIGEEHFGYQASLNLNGTCEIWASQLNNSESVCVWPAARADGTIGYATARTKERAEHLIRAACASESP